MKKKNIIAISLIIILLVSIFSLKFMIDHKNEQSGQEKFNKAISELRNSDPQFDNPCLGTSLLRSYSYSELNSKTLNEIKELAKRDPGSC